MNKLSRKTVRYIVLSVLALVFLLPLLWMISTSFKTSFEAGQSTSFVPEDFTVRSYLPLITWTGQTPVLRWFVNSLLVASATTFLVLVVDSLAAYALARMSFRGRGLVLMLVIGTLFVPAFIFLIPNYLIVNSMGLLDTLWALILPAGGGALGVFLLVQFYRQIPTELEEAALLDGANQFKIYWHIILPLSKPALATLGIVTFLASWNDFLWPIYALFTSENLTLPAGLPLLQSANVTDYPTIMAGAVLASIPALIVFIIAQRKIIESVATVGMKG